MNTERAVCPHCGKTVAVRIPAGGDGSRLVYGWHLNGELTAERCIGVKSLVEPGAMVP